MSVAAESSALAAASAFDWPVSVSEGANLLLGSAADFVLFGAGVIAEFGVDFFERTTGSGPVSSKPVSRAVSISASSSSIVVSDTVWPAVSAAARASDIEIVNSSEMSSSARRTVS